MAVLRNEDCQEALRKDSFQMYTEEVRYSAFSQSIKKFLASKKVLCSIISDKLTNCCRIAHKTFQGFTQGNN